MMTSSEKQFRRGRTCLFIYYSMCLDGDSRKRVTTLLQAKYSIYKFKYLYPMKTGCLEIFIPFRLKRLFISFPRVFTLHVRGQVTWTISVLNALLLEFQTFSAVLQKLCFTSNIFWNLKWLSQRGTFRQGHHYSILCDIQIPHILYRQGFWYEWQQYALPATAARAVYIRVKILSIFCRSGHSHNYVYEHHMVYTADKTSSLNNPDVHMLRFDLQPRLCQ